MDIPNPGISCCKTLWTAFVESSKAKWTRWSWEVPLNPSGSVKSPKNVKCCITNNFDYSDCNNHQDNPSSIQTPAQSLGTAKNQQENNDHYNQFGLDSFDQSVSRKFTGIGMWLHITDRNLGLNSHIDMHFTKSSFSSWGRGNNDSMSWFSWGFQYLMRVVRIVLLFNNTVLKLLLQRMNLQKTEARLP